MEDYAPSICLGNWVLVALHLCFRFHIFDRLVLEEYVSQVEAHLLQFCLGIAQDGLPFTIKDMHLSFENLAVTNAPSLHASLMDFHHDTFFRYILEDDSIS
jgi:hypothetical protein